MADFEASVEIAADARLVWAVLLDLPRYGEWNTFCPRVESSLRVGEPALLHVRMNRRTKVRQKLVVRVVDHEGMQLRWGASLGLPFIMRAERSQSVEALGPGRCRYRSEESFTGLIAPIIRGIFGSDVQRGFEVTAAGLKRQAERLTLRQEGPSSSPQAGDPR